MKFRHGQKEGEREREMDSNSTTSNLFSTESHVNLTTRIFFPLYIYKYYNIFVYSKNESNDI